MASERGHHIVASVVSVKGTCNAGHKPGDVIEVSARQTGGMCGYLYHAAFPYILMLQFGGSFPWDDPNAVELTCPDTQNLLTVRIRRTD